MSAVYAADAPSVLPPSTLLAGIARRVRASISTGLRVLFVAFMWCYMLPLGSSVLYRLYTGQSPLNPLVIAEDPASAMRELALGMYDIISDCIIAIITLSRELVLMATFTTVGCSSSSSRP